MKKIAKGIWNQIQRRIEDTNESIRESREYKAYQGPLTQELKVLADKINENEKIVELYKRQNEDLAKAIKNLAGAQNEWDSYQNIIARVENREKNDHFNPLPELSYSKLDEITAELELWVTQYGEIPADIIGQGNYESENPDQLMTALVNYFQNKLA